MSINQINLKRCCLFIILVCGLSNSVFSQLSLYKEYGVERMGSIESFLEDNDFEYAIVANSTSSRMFGERNFSCLAKQKGSWYLFQISGPSTFAAAGELRVRPVIKQKNLTASEADSLLSLIEPEKGMKHIQEEFYALPSTCKSEFRGRKGVAGDVSDVSTYHLTEKSDKGIISLNFYAADFYLRNCLPLNAEFKILIGMVNSVDQLISAANAL